MATIFDYITDNLTKFKFLKWVQIIKTESEATKKSALYFLEKNNTSFEVIVTDDSGAKRKLRGDINQNELESSFAKIDASNITPEFADLWKEALSLLDENIGNADLEMSGDRILSQGEFSFTHDTNGKPYIISGLEDRSGDTSFNLMKVQDQNGREGFATNAYTVLKNTFENITASQALELGQLLNGGSGSDGAMSVNLISPPIVERIDSIEYVLLRGANLNLNATSKKIEIVALDSNVIIATIPDSQIQMDASGTSLIFYYNFKDIPIGEFKIKLTSGVKTYITTLTIKTVADIENINLDAVTWDVIYANGITPSASDTAIGRSASLNTPTGVSYGGGDIKISAKSSELFSQGEDFYIEASVVLGYKNANNSEDLNPSYIGIGYSSTPNTLSPSSLIHLSYGYSYNTEIIAKNNNINIGGSTPTPVTYTVIIIKTGNLFRTIIGGVSHQLTLSNNAGYSMFINLVGRSSGTIQTVYTQLIKAYKFS